MCRLYHVYILLTALSCIHADYWQDRQEFIQMEDDLAIGRKLNLSRIEMLANKHLMQVKLKEFLHGFQHPEDFLPAQHFFHARHDIAKSEVFKFIKNMPKGGALHVHDIAMCSVDYVIKNITYRNDLYVNVNGNNIVLRFANGPPSKAWTLINNIRSRDAHFDTFLRTKFTLVVPNPNEKYPDVNTVWQAFGKLFQILTPLLTYRPVFEDYFYNALKEFYKDNVHYMEIRGTLPSVYDLDGNTYDSIHVLGLLQNVADKFMADHPDFIGVKYIYAPVRFVDNKTMSEYVATYKKLKLLYPKFLVGFDLVGQEDLGEPLYKFINELTSFPFDTKFFFHAGETNWNGMLTDMNLIDAVLLNATRIGHGYAVLNHPKVLQEVKRKRIAIEVNPISNQVLSLVKDLRNHPANILIANNYPVVISSDDPGLWGAYGLSYDFYEAFMGMASKAADLRLLKQLAINSIKYSSMNQAEKRIAMNKFNNQWTKFIIYSISKKRK